MAGSFSRPNTWRYRRMGQEKMGQEKMRQEEGEIPQSQEVHRDPMNYL